MKRPIVLGKHHSSFPCSLCCLGKEQVRTLDSEVRRLALGEKMKRSWVITSNRSGQCWGLHTLSHCKPNEVHEKPLGFLRFVMFRFVPDHVNSVWCIKLNGLFTYVGVCFSCWATQNLQNNSLYIYIVHWVCHTHGNVFSSQMSFWGSHREREDVQWKKKVG